MKSLLCTLLLLVGTSTVYAATIYDVNLPIEGGGITGTIETDGTLGPLLTENILSFNLVFSDGIDTQVVTSTSASTSLVSNGLLRASADGLVLDFTNPSSTNPFNTFQIAYNGLPTGPGEAFLFDTQLGVAGVNPSGYLISHFINVNTNNIEELRRVVVVGFGLGEVSFGTIQPTAVPIPAALPLFLVSLFGLGLIRRHKFKVQLAA